MNEWNRKWTKWMDGMIWQAECSANVLYVICKQTECSRNVAECEFLNALTQCLARITFHPVHYYVSWQSSISVLACFSMVIGLSQNRNDDRDIAMVKVEVAWFSRFGCSTTWCHACTIQHINNVKPSSQSLSSRSSHRSIVMRIPRWQKLLHMWGELDESRKHIRIPAMIMHRLQAHKDWYIQYNLLLFV